MKQPINITIFSLGEITKRIKEKPTGFNIVSIRSSDISPAKYDVFDKYRSNYRDIIIECFDDIKAPQDGFITPMKEHIRRILKWAMDKENIVVHCTAGISRSSAIAYLIACQMSSPKQALKVFDPLKHCPNRLILNIGVEVLGDESILSEYLKWFDRTYKAY